MLAAGHRIRDGEFERLPNEIVDTGEVFDCVVVGGGISGLAAALFFLRKSGKNRSCLVLDNHPVFGGEAKRNEFVVDGHRLMAHQGSAVFFVQYPHSFLGRFYDSIGLKTPKLQYQKWAGPAKEMALSKTPYDMVGLEPATYGLYFGAKFGQKDGTWLIDPWGKKLEGAPISETARNELLKWRAGPAEAGPAKKEKRPQYFGDEISRYLDSITLEEHMMRRFGISRETIRTFLSPVEGGGSGLGPDVLSAYADYAADLLHPLQSDDTDQMFPGGNTGIARLMAKTLIPKSIAGDDSMEAVCRNEINFGALDQPNSPARIRLNSTAVWVKHDGDPDKSESVSIRLYAGRENISGKGAHGCHGRRWLDHQAHCSRSSTSAAAGLRPVLPLSVHDGECGPTELAFSLQDGDHRVSLVRGRGQLYGGAEDRIGGSGLANDQPGFSGGASAEGFVFLSRVADRRSGAPGPRRDAGNSFQRIRTANSRAVYQPCSAAPGFDARRDIAGIILNRWGHAYLNPQPGFFFGKDGKPAPGEVLRATPFGRIAFANTDLAGIMDHRCSILEAERAVGQLLEQVLTD